MNSRLSKLLKTEFHKRMAAALPEFEKIGTDFGGVMYRKKNMAGRRFLFIFLYPHSKIDSFTIEFAASAKPDYPFEILPGEQVPEGDVRCRIAKLLGMKMDHWWHLNRSHTLEPGIEKYPEDRGNIEAAKSKIPAAVQDAIDRILATLPHFVNSLE